jgi:hypothetical protein
MHVTSTERTGGASSLPSETAPQALPADLSTALLSLMIGSRGAQSEASKEEIERAHALAEHARREIEEAMRRAEEAQENAGFWGELGSVFGGDVAAICAAVASAALIVGTGGTGAAAVVALVAAGLSTGATVGKEIGLPPALCTALSAAGVLVGVASANFSSASNAWTTLASAARVGESGATAVSGAAKIAEGQYEADALDARADATSAQHRQDDAWFRLDVALSLLEQAARDLRRGKSSVAEIQRIEHEGNTALIAQIGAAS